MLREALTTDRLRGMEPDEAAAYFVAYGAEGLTATERTLLADWLSKDSAHPAALDRANRAWGCFQEVDDDEILSAMRAHARAAPVRHRQLWRVAVAAAAALILVVGASVLLIGRPGSSPKPGGAQGAAIDYASAPTQIKQVTLPDGSQMTLDADSQVRGRFAANGRSLELVRGRAFFDVRHDAARPFAVTAATRRIVDVGTRFGVSVIGGGLRVTLEQGRVAVQSLTAGVSSVALEPGQEFVETGDGVTVRSIGTTDTSSGWRRGLIDLEDTPLGDAVAEINRYSVAKIVVRDNRLQKIRVSGQFRTGDAERFARTVAELHPVRVTHAGNTIDMAPSK